MTTGEMVVDVSQDWLLACHVQQGFMKARLADNTPRVSASDAALTSDLPRTEWQVWIGRYTAPP
jgi:hypothetical protein